MTTLRPRHAARRWPAVLAVAAALAGCSSTGGATNRLAAGNDVPPTVSPAASPTARSTAMPPTAAAPGAPSSAARMVCGGEIRRDVRFLFRLSQAPVPTATWRNGVYQCRYRPRDGRFDIAVSEDGTHR